MYVSSHSWPTQAALSSAQPTSQRDEARLASVEVSLDFRTYAPLVPDMKFGRVWGEVVVAYAHRWGVLPSVLRVLRTSATHAAVIEMQVDADGYGRVGIIGEVSIDALDGTLSALGGRFSHVILDDRLQSEVQIAGSCVSDTDLHGRAYEVLGRSFGVDVAAWRRRLCDDIGTGRALPTRTAMERVRGEVAVLVSLLQSAS